mgnify:CR=1 FL=1|jgi:hypothetical protein
MSTNTHKGKRPNKSLVKKGLFVLLLFALLLSIQACELTISATRTPPATVGSTVFAILQWKPSDRAIDVVFVPDGGYGNLTTTANRQNFFDDVADLIDEGFYQNNAVAMNISLFNFWYMLNTGTVTPPASGICPTLTWPNLTDAAFAEMVVIVHRNTAVRDCGGGGRASARAGGGREWIVLHEGGHAIFGLPDEYCCDGGYWHVPPILYNSQASCTSDAANAGWRNCQSFTANNGSVWWRSEGLIVDLMSAAGPPVHEFGQADWVRVNTVLSGLPGASVNNPTVFAPTGWDWP